jgi:hypothetical protein
MMNAMQKEVDNQDLGMVRHVKIDVEQKPVKPVFEQRPHEIAKEEAQGRLEICAGGEGEDEAKREIWIYFEGCQRDTAELQKRAQADVRRYRQPQRGHHPPLGPREHLRGLALMNFQRSKKYNEPQVLVVQRDAQTREGASVGEPVEDNTLCWVGEARSEHTEPE